jgi:hypothetical protein
MLKSQTNNQQTTNHMKKNTINHRTDYGNQCGLPPLYPSAISGARARLSQPQQI